MLDINFILDNVEVVKQAAVHKNLDPTLIDQLVVVDQERRQLIAKAQEIRTAKNLLDRQLKIERNQEAMDQSKQLKLEIQAIEPSLKDVEERFNQIMRQIPNVPAADVPIGLDETGNQIYKSWGKQRDFKFTPKTHDQLALDLDLYDSKRAVRIAGSRAYFLKNQLVTLEQAVLRYALDLMIKEGFIPMTVPWLVNPNALEGTGYFPWGEQDHYHTQDGQGLIGTAEVSLTAYHMGETIPFQQLPIKLCGISPCFRREVGSYGKDTKGFFRVHQFTKVEMVVMLPADEELSRKWHDQMLGYSEQFLQNLKLPYQVLLMCTGDMGAGQRKKYDIETWFPGQNIYRETHSDSYFNDFQSRRLNTRYLDKDGQLKFVYTLNNTVAASPRILAAILENYQQADGSIQIPEALIPYTGFEQISLPSRA